MSKVFPAPVICLPEVDIPIDGAMGFLSRGKDYRIIFMELGKDVYQLKKK